MISNRLFNKIKPIWDSYIEHEFIKGITDGTLDVEKFKFYLIQDYLYLLDYAKVFAYGVIKSKNEKHMKIFSSLIGGVIDSEASTHRNYFSEFSINNAEDYEASLTTQSYTKYMLSVAATEGVAEIAVAVLACSWSYKYIADEIKGKGDHGFYKDWVDMYASEGYEVLNDGIIKLVDELTVNYSEKQIKNLETIIVNCSRYEYMFWDMAYNKEM